MHRPDVLVVGQGLAGTLLGWELEQAGISFAVVDDGRTPAASHVAAGIISPVTGRRLVTSWRAETLVPLARATYRALGSAWAVPLWRDVRIRRIFVDERERRVHAQRAAGEAGFVGPADDQGFWIERAGRVDFRALLAAGRDHWRRTGRLIETRWSNEAGLATPAAVGATRPPLAEAAVVIDCRGVAGTRAGPFSFVPWEYSKGEILDLAVTGLDPGVVLNRGHWVLPVEAGSAWVGATHEPGVLDDQPTATAREVLEASARALLERPFHVRGHFAGVRVNLPDKHPVAGRHPQQPRLGLLNGLGAKGGLYAPWLARAWARHLQTGAAFDPAVAVGRFWTRAVAAG